MLVSELPTLGSNRLPLQLQAPQLFWEFKQQIWDLTVQSGIQKFGGFTTLVEASGTRRIASFPVPAPKCAWETTPAADSTHNTAP